MYSFSELKNKAIAAARVAQSKGAEITERVAACAHEFNASEEGKLARTVAVAVGAMCVTIEVCNRVFDEV